METNQNEVQNFIRIIIIVMIVFLAFYFLTVFTTGRRKASYTQKQPALTVIQYDEIIYGNLYTQNKPEYFVLLEEKENPYNALFESMLTQASVKEGGIPYYTLDLSSAFNQKLVSDTMSLDSNDLKVNRTTLLKIQNGTLNAYYEDDEKILAFLQSLSSSK